MGVCLFSEKILEKKIIAVNLTISDGWRVRPQRFSQRLAPRDEWPIDGKKIKASKTIEIKYK